MSPITVVVADQDARMRTTCVQLLQSTQGIRVVREASNDEEALAALAAKPKVFLLNQDLCPGYGDALLRLARRASPRTKVLLFSRQASEANMLDALAHGARGYLDTRAIHSFLSKAVRAVDAGEAWIPRAVVARIVDRLMRLAGEHPASRS
jgi:two-component system, NarL family, response regulator